MTPIFTPTARQVRERVARMVAERPAAGHLTPVFLAATRGVLVAVIGQGRHVFALPPGRPAVLIIGDDAAASRGPDGFHRASLRRALRRATHVAVRAGAPVPAVYAAAPEPALAGGGAVVLIETRERHEADWVAFVRRHAPDAACLLVTPPPTGSA